MHSDELYDIVTFEFQIISLHSLVVFQEFLWLLSRLYFNFLHVHARSNSPLPIQLFNSTISFFSTNQFYYLFHTTENISIRSFLTLINNRLKGNTNPTKEIVLLKENRFISICKSNGIDFSDNSNPISFLKQHFINITMTLSYYRLALNNSQWRYRKRVYFSYCSIRNEALKNEQLEASFWKIMITKYGISTGKSD